MQFIVVFLDVLLAFLVVFPAEICGQQHQHQQQQHHHQPSRNLVIDAAAPVPTCAHLVDTEQFYFPNDCVTKCSERDGGGTFDTDRSRNVNGQLQCYCVDDASPVCTDDPRCADLAVVPGTAFDNCLNHVCLPKLSTTGESSTPVVVVTDAIEYATDSTAANKAQTHQLVACSCDGGVTQECGVDSILFSDTNYLPRCTTIDEKQKNENGVAPDSNTLNIYSQDDCTTYCTSSSSSFGEGDWKSIELVSSSSTSQQQQQFACICIDKSFEKNGKSVVACDDAKAKFNDGSGAGTDCYDTVGVNRINCPDDSSSSTNYNRNSHNFVVYTHVLAVVLLFMMS